MRILPHVPLRPIRTMIFALAIAAMPASAFAGIFISVGIAPPPLPVYTQPPCPVAGYMWTPGYWAYGPMGYYWVPGVWVQPPAIGLLWTPGYWGWSGGLYRWNAGYWGRHIGFYGGVNYGHGYGGIGYEGGYWHGNNFYYNRSVTNVNTTIIHNTYNRTVVVNNRYNSRVSYNGGQGGIDARASRREMQASRDQHYQLTSAQVSHRDNAGANRSQLYSQNRGRPAIAARQSVNGRAYNQQGRIAQGIRSGQMSSGEAARAENRQQNIDRSVRQDRRANDGRLTGPERRNINQRQNRASNQIYREKHNDVHGRR